MATNIKELLSVDLFKELLEEQMQATLGIEGFKYIAIKTGVKAIVNISNKYLKIKNYEKLAKYYYRLPIEEREEFLKNDLKTIKSKIKEIKIDKDEKYGEEVYIKILDKIIVNILCDNKIENLNGINILELNEIVMLLDLNKLTFIKKFHYNSKTNLFSKFSMYKYKKLKIADKEKEFLKRINIAYGNTKAGLEFIYDLEKFLKDFNNISMNYEMAIFLHRCIEIYNEIFEENKSFDIIYSKIKK